MNAIPKPYVPVVTLPINDNIKFLENINPCFKRTTFWNKCKSKKQYNQKTII